MPVATVRLATAERGRIMPPMRRIGVSLGQGTGPRRVDGRAAYRASFRQAYPRQKSVVRRLDEHSQAEIDASAAH
jgi:hypothetical protein